MASKQQREQVARDEAATLARIAMRMQRVSKDKMDDLLDEADRCLKRYKRARFCIFVGDDKAVGTIDDQVVEGLKASMQALGGVIRDTIAPRAYCLLVFEPDDVGNAGDKLAYVSNANRDNVCEAMRQFIVAHEKSK